jgi:hypothetical protein
LATAINDATLDILYEKLLEEEDKILLLKKKREIKLSRR